MNLLPKASGTRPRVACDISAQGVVAARSDAPDAALAAVARVELVFGAVVPGLKPGNVANRVAVVAAVRKTLESVGMRPGARDVDMSLVIPDSAVRVSMLEFDALPTKLTEALPLVRFRLKKMLPFDADDAMVTFQVMSTSKTLVRVLAVAIPRDVLGEYEGVVREAGFEPGAVVPSTLASLAAMDEDPALVVNANVLGVTAAIVRGGIVMLHRSVDLQVQPMGVPANLPPALFDDPSHALLSMTLPLVSVEETAGEWAAQEALPEHGRNPYADRVDGETAVQDIDGITGMPLSPLVIAPESAVAVDTETVVTAPPARIELGEEIASAVSVAVAYFEDTLAVTPEMILSAGPLGATELQRILRDHGVTQTDGFKVRELVSTEALMADATRVPRGWLSGVLGALRA